MPSGGTTSAVGDWLRVALPSLQRVQRVVSYGQACLGSVTFRAGLSIFVVASGRASPNVVSAGTCKFCEPLAIDCGRNGNFRRL